MARMLNCYLEVKAKDELGNVIKAMKAIRESTLNGFPVIGVANNGSDRVTVPDFGHNAHCKCERPVEGGVTRLFGLTAAVEGEPDGKDIIGEYPIRDYAVFTVCGVFLPYEGSRKNLKRSVAP